EYYCWLHYGGAHWVF
nr:immunoglobulin light chain junction region [Macaca mulatta]MOX78503.1 immunoglobulin light chain junction region [Macaca mulatta]MOX78699.1 immunoglobulin light chain junction region [Macaca mulatta]MOX79009.1 immunoglobulin light chain junction region [Macaca mulatta]MOX79092.1 immunoglobulin light chain junction region [Macaca mulatta]